MPVTFYVTLMIIILTQIGRLCFVDKNVEGMISCILPMMNWFENLNKYRPSKYITFFKVFIMLFFVFTVF